MRGALAGLVLTALLAGCATAPVEPEPEFPEEIPLQAVRHVDLARYMGRWYMIANIPYFAEAGNLATYVEYRMRPDGLIEDRLTARDSFDQPPFTKDGLIEITDADSNAEGLITFLKPIWQPFSIVYLDEGYRHTIVAHPSRDYAWLFAREPQVDDRVYRKMLATLADNGFDTSRVLRIPQRPEQVGQAGFQ